MKHLTILEEAKLIVVRRSGRERWNYLNAAPLQVIYERWVKPYEAVCGRKLTGLKSNSEGSNMATATVGNVSQVEMKIEIAASRERVWEALIEETTFWWPRDFYTSQKAKSFHIEPKLGGGCTRIGARAKAAFGTRCSVSRRNAHSTCKDAWPCRMGRHTRCCS